MMAQHNGGGSGIGYVVNNSDYVQSSQMPQQPPFFTQANAAAGIGTCLLKAGNVTISQQQSESPQKQRDASNQQQQQKHMDNLSTKSNKILDQSDDCVAYASKEKFNEVIKPSTVDKKEGDNPNHQQSTSALRDMADKPQSTNSSLRKSTNLVISGGNKLNNNRTLNSIQSKSTHHGGSNTAGSNTESNNTTAGSNDISKQ